MHLDHLARMRAGNFYRRLVCLEFNQPLIFFDYIAFAHEHFEHITGMDPIAQGGQLDFYRHVGFSLLSNNGRRTVSCAGYSVYVVRQARPSQQNGPAVGSG